MKTGAGFLCVLLVFMLLAQAVVLADAKDSAPSDNAYEKLRAFGILSEGEFISKQYITRGDLTKLIVKMNNLEPELIAGRAYPFSDVAESDPNYMYIYTAYYLQLIDGYTRGETFGAGDYVNMQQAIKMMLNSLGYRTLAEARGGFPTGYLTLANDAGILNYIDTTNAERITPQEIFHLAYNVLDAEIMVNNVIGQTNRYTTNENRTLLSERFGIYKKEGVVNSNQYTDLLTSETKTPDGHISIDDMEFKVGGTNAEDMLGYYVEAYYRENVSKSERTLIYIDPVQSRNTVWTVKEQDIAGYNGITELSVYTADAVKERLIKISTTASLIYNGKLALLKESVWQELMLGVGEAVLIDNNSDARADVIKIMSYRTIVVDGVSDFNYTISDKLGGSPVTVDPDDSTYDVKILYNGEKLSTDDVFIEQIKEWMIISYAESKADGNQVKFLLISDRSISGTVEAVGKETIEFDHESYKATESLLMTVSVGEDGIFYFDSFDRIVAKRTVSDVVYGYLYDIHKESFDKAELRIFTENNRWVNLTLRNKVIHNGESIKSDDLYNLLNNLADYRQLITYKVNSDREIIELNTAKEFEPWSEQEKTAIEQNIFRLSRRITGAYRNPTSYIENVLGFSGDIRIFMIPASNEEEDFYIANRSSMIADRVYTVLGYDADEIVMSSVCVIKYSEVPITENSNNMIIHRLGEGLNSEGMATYAINGMCNRYELSIYPKNKELVDNIGGLKPGDVIRFALDSKGDVTTIIKVYDSTSGSEQKYVANGLYAVDTLIAGRIEQVDIARSRFAVTYSEGGDPGVFGFNSVKTIYIYDKKLERTFVGTVNDIEKGRYMIGGFRYFQANEILVIRD